MNKFVKLSAIVATSALVTTGLAESVALPLSLVNHVYAAEQGNSKNNPITLDSSVYDDLSGKQFAKKYKDKFVQFDGLLTSIRKYDHYKNKVNLSLVIGDDKGAMFTDATTPLYMIAKDSDLPAATQGWIKKTKSVNSNLHDSPENVHVTAKVKGYMTVKDGKGSSDMKGKAVYLKPVKIGDDAAIYTK